MTSSGVVDGMPIFERDLHLGYFIRMLHELPGAYGGEESNRLSLAYFAIAALDIMGKMDEVPAKETITWIYGLQVLPLSVGEFSNCAISWDGTGTTSDTTFGFRGSSSIGIKFNGNGAHPIAHDGGHLAMTYSALAVLTILGDDLSRVSRKAILDSLRKLQQPDGSFSPRHLDKQTDLRFVFCAAAISVMLDDWNGMDRHKAVEFILKSQSYEGGFSLSPGLESHGGATYCGLAALWLIIEFDPSWPASKTLESLLNVDHTMKWCLQRQAQNGGFQSRPNKPADACYAFWIGGVLKMFAMEKLCDRNALRVFLLSCQSKWGGFSKYPDDAFPDLLHSYYAVCGFSLLEEPGFDPLVFGLGITGRSAGRLSALKSKIPNMDSFAP